MELIRRHAFTHFTSPTIQILTMETISLFFKRIIARRTISFSQWSFWMDSSGIFTTNIYHTVFSMTRAHSKWNQPRGTQATSTFIRQGYFWLLLTVSSITFKTINLVSEIKRKITIPVTVGRNRNTWLPLPTGSVREQKKMSILNTLKMQSIEHFPGKILNFLMWSVFVLCNQSEKPSFNVLFYCLINAYNNYYSSQYCSV